MRIAVIGCGSIGRRHLLNLRKLGLTDVVAFDPVATAREHVERELGVNSAATLDQLLAKKPVVVLIAAPSSLHCELALEAASRGCHIFVEKPLSHSEEGLERLVAEVDRRHLITMVGCNMRFHPGPARVKALLNAGVIGRPLFARVFGGSYLPHWHPLQDYRRSYSANVTMGGGCILDGIHEIDLAYWYLGEVKSVVALASQLGDLELNRVEDVASLILQHTGGQHSEVHLDYVQRVRIRGCVIVGTEGTISWEWSDHHVRLYRPEAGQWSVEPLPADWEINDMYMDEMKHFLDAVRFQQSPCNSIKEAARVTHIALAAKQASVQRRFMDVLEGTT